MARPKQDPVLRFSDVAAYLQAALDNNGLRFATPSRARAVHIAHRLNLYRKAMRELSDAPFIEADRYIIRTVGEYIEIEPRPVPDFSNATTIDGQPLKEKEYRPVPEFEEAAKRVQAGDMLLTYEEWAMANEVLVGAGMEPLPMSKIRTVNFDEKRRTEGLALDTEC